MKKTTILTILLLLSANIAIAQKEVYLYNEEDIKNLKAQKVQGIGFSTDILQFGLNRHIFTNLHYFHENSFANSFTLHKSIALNNDFYRFNWFCYDEINENSYLSNEKKYFYYLNFQASVAARWYFTLKNRYTNNKNTISNSGWYLSLPLNLKIPIIAQPINKHMYDKWLVGGFMLEADISPGIGYRHAFNRNLFIESDVNISLFTLHVSKSVFNFSDKALKNKLNLNLKIAYTF